MADVRQSGSGARIGQRVMFDQGTATFVGLGIVIILVVADVVLANDATRDNAPSQIIRAVSRYTAVVPFGLGVLTGHWFHPVVAAAPLLGSRSQLYLVFIGVVLGAGGLVLGLRRSGIPAWPWALAGAILGALLWPVS